MYLLDTNVLLWYFSNDPQLSGRIFALIDDERAKCHYSVVSLWEIVLKVRKGKLRLPEPIFDILPMLNMRELPLQQRHFESLLEASPTSIADPFDQIIITQAQTGRLTLVTSDEHILNLQEPGLARMDSRT